ncbi:MAG: deoxynucleoside kinase [Bacteroidales bacterium]|jgi:deoxyadenosine/deoxycytidine kinase|nr:deoxynucleoside kinase [Bacteroidales bacterium]
MYIAIAGNIGSGKTTLTELLSKQYGWTPIYEDPEDNPYLDDFYKDMQRWAFNLQIHFLHARYRQILSIQAEAQTVIQDRTIFEDAEIFASNLQSMGLLSMRDFTNYMSIYELIGNIIKAPDLLIYLRASVPTLVKQIQKRGREYESSIRLDYLSQLNQRYEAWISRYKKSEVMIIDIDRTNFIDNPNDISMVSDRIDAHIHGLFPTK